MIDGEGVEENASSAVASPDDPAGDRESDGGDDLSHYSSCGGESEFERYCSASSAIGTPSFLSSSFPDSEFGSLKNFTLGGENTNFKNFVAKKRLSGSQDRGNGFYSDTADNGVLNLERRMEGFIVSGADLTEFDVNNSWSNESENMEENRIIAGSGAFRGIEDGEGCYRGVDERDDERERREIVGIEGKKWSDESEGSSRYEHSEGEDSMFGCGSGDEKDDSYYGKNVRFHGEESGKNESQLAMNSAVAFGCDDWDDFVQASGENNIGLMVGEEFLGEEHNSSLSLTAANLVQNKARCTSPSCNQVRGGRSVTETNLNAISANSMNYGKTDARVEDVQKVHVSSNEASDMDELEGYLGCSSENNLFEGNTDLSIKEAQRTVNSIDEAEPEKKYQDTSTSEVVDIVHNAVSKNIDLEKTNAELDPLSESMVNHLSRVSVKDKEEDTRETNYDDNRSVGLSSLPDNSRSVAAEQNSAFSFDRVEDHFVPVQTRDFELNDFYDEIVHDMEDILLDSGESPGSRFTHNSRTYESQFPRPSRDGGSSASTSDADYAYNSIQTPFRIDRVEVVGARQKEGDVSLSERLVGVKKYTVYKIKVWSRRKHWEVERRYRDFSILYHRLKKLFAEHGWTLPSQWSFVERESLKLFGNASPDVIADRSVLIQECLQSVIHPKFSSSSLNALVCFLSPTQNTTLPQSPSPSKEKELESVISFGKTISLIVQIRPLKSEKQILDAQHYRCAGCHRSFDDGTTRVQVFVQALGWGKPRLCEYSGQLFCSSCHNNDTAVLPARVLHYWDFTRYPVSQLAKSYLDSIYDQPMLCVSAVNPFLFSKVPTLQHLANTRNRIRAMLPYVRCPFRGSINRGLGSRRYLLDSHDFFALRDLIDLSRGVFAALPVMVETVSRKIQEHIMEQCLICYDVGTPCGARQGCKNPLSLIFPFQEGEIKKCKSCELVFHKNCFKEMVSCPSCGARFKKEANPSAGDRIHRVDGNSNSLQEGIAESSKGLLTGLFSKVMPRSYILRKQEPQDVDNVILMGSLPNTSL